MLTVSSNQLLFSSFFFSFLAAFNDLFGGGSGGDFTQDDLFNMFFNGQMPNNGRFRMYTTYTRNGRRTTSSGAGGAGGRGGARASTAGDHAGGGAGGQRAQTGLWQLLIQLCVFLVDKLKLNSIHLLIAGSPSSSFSSFS